MKKTIIWACALLVVGSITLISCGKYDEGPGLSLRSKTGRLAGDWKVEKSTVSNALGSINNTATYDGYTWTFEKDGAATFKYGAFTSVATWKFNDDKSIVIMTYSVTGSVDSMPLTRLTNKEFWTKEVYGGSTEERHFVAHGH